MERNSRNWGRVILTLLSLNLILLIGAGCGEKKLSPGTYDVAVTLEGGSGRASVKSPATLQVTEEGQSIILVWNSKNYDYMIVGGEKYLNEKVGEDSTFHFPIEDVNQPITVIGDTVAMSVPHEIEYTLRFSLEK